MNEGAVVSDCLAGVAKREKRIGEALASRWRSKTSNREGRRRDRFERWKNGPSSREGGVALARSSRQVFERSKANVSDDPA